MPLLSIVVPALDRPDTLRHALATSDTGFTMTDNWEAARGHAAGEYVAFMGSPACAD